MPTRHNFKLLQKDVKHARIRVSEDRSIRVVLPIRFEPGEASKLVEIKSNWIDKSLRYFERKSRIKLNRNELLLYGNRYRYFFDASVKRGAVVDHEHLTIRSGDDLLVEELQTKWYRNLAKTYLIGRTDELSSRLGLNYNRVFIRSQKKKWGNCSANKNISLNWRLIKAPVFVIDYLIIHELVHTHTLSHRRKFWTLLRSINPDYRDAIEWLEKYGNSL